jgi:hypothetical protein
VKIPERPQSLADKPILDTSTTIMTVDMCIKEATKIDIESWKHMGIMKN